MVDLSPSDSSVFASIKLGFSEAVSSLLVCTIVDPVRHEAEGMEYEAVHCTMSIVRAERDDHRYSACFSSSHSVCTPSPWDDAAQIPGELPSSVKPLWRHLWDHT